MDPQQALAELNSRKILYQRAEPHGNVRVPVRLTGRLRGVHIHSSLAEHERPTTPYEICDARFVLALDDFAAQLEKRGIVELVHYTMYRPPPEPATSTTSATSDSAAWSGDAAKFAGPGYWIGESADRTQAYGSKTNSGAKPARSAAPGTAGKNPKTTNKRTAAPARPRIVTGPSRHSVGLAIDSGVFIKRDGTILSVASHFHGKIGAQTCGPGVPRPSDSRAEELLDIVCDAFSAKIFTTVLTPNFDKSHEDHFHMEINPGVRWFLYH